MIYSGQNTRWFLALPCKHRYLTRLVFFPLILTLLLQLGACSGERYTALMNAARNGDTEAVRKMLDLGAEVDQKTSKGKTALMLAAAGGFTDTVKLLVDRGADVNMRDNYDTTAVIAAATAGHPETASALVVYGADPLFKDTSGGSALSNATFFGHTETVLAILNELPELPAEAGSELLLLAAGLGHEKIASALLNKGISVNTRGLKDRTPLMAAAAFNKPQLVKLLLDKGADVSLSDDEGITALQVAENKGNQEIIALLRTAQSGANTNRQAQSAKD
ncbi:ankyrin repeat domain-containing protein [Kaarinaea lacus]